MADEDLTATPLALGMTVHEQEGESPQVLIFLSNDEGIVGVLDPDIAAQIGTTMMALSIEAQIMQRQLSDMTHDEQQKALEEVRRRYASPMN